MEAIWFYQEGNQHRGPVSVEQLLAALLAAPDPRRVLVWHAGLAGWVEAGLVPEIGQQLPPPLPSLALRDPRFRLLTLEEVEAVARLYRRLVLLVGLQLLLSFVQIPMTMVPEAYKTYAAVAILVVVLGLLGAIAVTAHHLTLLLDEPWPALWAVAMFLPCINVLVLLVLSSKAQDWCRRYGIKVGFLGPTPESIEALRQNTPR